MVKKHLRAVVAIAALVAGALIALPAGAGSLPNVASLDTSLPTSTLRLTMAGSGTVRLTSTGVAPPGSRSPVPGQTNCSAECNMTYVTGALVNMVATPAAGSVFTGWKVSDRVTGRVLCSSPRCIVAMFGARDVVASFAPTYTLRIDLTGVMPYFKGGVVDSADGKIHCRFPTTPTSVCTAQYVEGTSVALHAEPDKDGYSYFVGYMGDCIALHTKDCSLVMDRAKTVGTLWGASACGGAFENGLGTKGCAGGLANPDV